MPYRTIAVLGGTGRQGRGIAQRLSQAGYRIVVGSRNPQRAAEAIASWPPGTGAITTAGYGDAIAAAEIIVLAVPFHAVTALLNAHQARFGPQALVVDVTVPVSFTGGTATMESVAEGSAAEHIRAHLPTHVALAGTFKTIPAHLMDEPNRTLDCDEFVCGDSPKARSEAAALVGAMPDLRAVDVGPLVRARSIEHLTLLAIGINRRHRIRDARFRVIGL